MVTSASALAQSAPADSTTYNMRALQFDKLGNVVCSDLTAAGNGTGAAIALRRGQHSTGERGLLDAG